MKRPNSRVLSISMGLILFVLFFSTVHGGLTTTSTTTTDTTVCGIDQGCVLQPDTLLLCLSQYFVRGDSLITPNDGVLYQKAKTTWVGVRYPAAVVYAANTGEIQRAVGCAVVSGYKVSPRGKGHSYGALSTMDGYLVVDTSRTCRLDAITHDPTETGDHLLRGSRYVGTLTLPSGCTNAVVLAETHARYSDVNGIALIGSCPSVGITGFVLGGGGGDTSPWVGYGADIAERFEIVLADGSVVNASSTENGDLYWSSRGGGGGNGIISSVTYRIVEAPHRRGGYTVLNFQLDTLPGDADGASRVARFLHYFFYELKKKISGKFGGSGILYGPTGEGTNCGEDGLCVQARFSLLYLGGYRRAIRDIERYILPNTEGLALGVTGVFPPVRKVYQNYEAVCLEDGCDLIPELSGMNISAVEFGTHAEAQAYKICTEDLWQNPITTGIDENSCTSLGIDEIYCFDFLLEYPEFFTTPLPTRRLVPTFCLQKVVIDALLEKFADPGSFVNQPGPSPEWVRYFANVSGIGDGDDGDDDDLERAYIAYARLDPFNLPNGYLPPTRTGGYMIPKVDDATLAKVLLTVDEISINHLMHGAAMKPKRTDTAHPWRDSALMCHTSTKLFNNTAKQTIFDVFREEENIRPRGYYAYVGPLVRNWR